MSGLSTALSKLGIGKHKKSRSQSSSSPSSPRQSVEASRTPVSPRTRQSLDVSSSSPRTPPKDAHVGSISNTSASRTSGNGEPVVVIGKEGLDGVGHSRAFSDEVNRPALPTTISNVDNPVPGDRFQTTASNAKALPTIPATPGEEGSRLGDTPSAPTSSTNSSQPPRLPEIPKSEPLHHVTSIDRQDILNDSHERPKPAVAASQGLTPPHDKVVDGRTFGHVQSVHSTIPEDGSGSRALQAGHGDSPMKKDHRVVDGLNVLAAGQSVKGIDIPERGTSKLFSSVPNTTSESSNQARTRPASDLAPRESLLSSRDPDLTPETHLANHLKLLGSHLYPTPAKSKVNLPLRLMNKTSGPGLEEQRNQLVASVVRDAQGRMKGRETLSEFGRGVFKAAGMENKLGSQDTVDVETQWLEPVVQEHIIRKEHTEYTIIINREIHKYHIYPKIQPVSDPNPIILQPRHRIFSPVTQKWHEVIGDRAAIEILGEDVFRNGPQEKKMIRGMALPGFGEVTRMTAEERREHGLDGFGSGDGEGSSVGGGKTLIREGIWGGEMGKWHLLSDERGIGSGKANATASTGTGVGSGRQANRDTDRNIVAGSLMRDGDQKVGYAL